jgi:hypothetical protein
MPDGLREPAGDPLQVGKNPVAPLIMQAGQGGIKKIFVIHTLAIPECVAGRIRPLWLGRGPY